MNQLIYRLLYRLTHPGWDTGQTPPEVLEALASGELPAGPALDLGCGTGTNVLTLARHGRQAIGVDFVPRAIAQAKAKARQTGLADQTRFYGADVTRLPGLRLPPCAFALDMGCFHGLNAQQQARYAAGLAAQLIPTGRFMLYAADPHTEGPVRFGVTRQQVESVFSASFTITHTERGKFGQNGTATWYWMTRR